MRARKSPVAFMLWPLVVYSTLVVILVCAILTLSWFLGQRHHDRDTGLPYESGVASQGSARVRVSAGYYLVAMFFVIFDLEAAFLFAWAVAAGNVGWPGYWEVVLFIAVLLVGLVYLARTGGLDWAPGRRHLR